MRDLVVQAMLPTSYETLMAADPALFAMLASKMGIDQGVVEEAIHAYAVDSSVHDFSLLERRLQVNGSSDSDFDWSDWASLWAGVSMTPCEEGLNALDTTDYEDMCPDAYPEYVELYDSDAMSDFPVNVCFDSTEEDCGVIENYLSALFCPASVVREMAMSLQACTEEDAEMMASFSALLLLFVIGLTCAVKPDVPSDGAFHECIESGTVNITEIFMSAAEGDLLYPMDGDSDGALSSMATAAAAGAVSLAVAAMLA